MIKGTIGSVEINEKSILVGEMHFIHTYKKNDATDTIEAGNPVCFVDEGGAAIVNGTFSGSEAIGIALNDSPKDSEESVRVVVFGQVKKSEVSLAEEPQLWKAVVKSLRHNGVYLV